MNNIYDMAFLALIGAVWTLFLSWVMTIVIPKRAMVVSATVGVVIATARLYFEPGPLTSDVTTTLVGVLAGGALMYYLLNRRLKREAAMERGALLIDDLRKLNVERTARSYNAGIEALAERHWDVLYLDHDLGDFSGPEGRERTGYDVMCWLEANTEHLPSKIVIVSANSVGRQRMTQVIDKLYGRER